jgi:hypothetical protein
MGNRKWIHGHFSNFSKGYKLSLNNQGIPLPPPKEGGGSLEMPFTILLCSFKAILNQAYLQYALKNKIILPSIFSSLITQLYAIFKKKQSMSC